MKICEQFTNFQLEKECFTFEMYNLTFIFEGYLSLFIHKSIILYYFILH